MFFRGSRYEHVADAGIDGPDGRTIRYKRMRFIPALAARLSIRAAEGDRADLLAYRALGDPEQFWRLCDANRVERPADLATASGGRVAVPGPDGAG